MTGTLLVWLWMKHYTGVCLLQVKEFLKENLQVKVEGSVVIVSVHLQWHSSGTSLQCNAVQVYLPKKISPVSFFLCQ